MFASTVRIDAAARSRVQHAAVVSPTAASSTLPPAINGFRHPSSCASCNPSVADRVIVKVVVAPRHGWRSLDDVRRQGAAMSGCLGKAGRAGVRASKIPGPGARAISATVHRAFRVAVQLLRPPCRKPGARARSSHVARRAVFPSSLSAARPRREGPRGDRGFSAPARLGRCGPCPVRAWPLAQVQQN